MLPLGRLLLLPLRGGLLLSLCRLLLLAPSGLLYTSVDNRRNKTTASTTLAGRWLLLLPRRGLLAAPTTALSRCLLLASGFVGQLR